MIPAPGERMLRFVGDRVRFSLRVPGGIPRGARALLRTNLGKAERLRQEIIATHAGKNPFSVAFWRDVPLQPQPDGEWAIEMPLTDVGFYRAKAYVVTADGLQVWPDGPDTGISVHPDCYRTANTIYCAFTRLFGETRSARVTKDEKFEQELVQLDQRGYAVIPPSGKFRDLTRQLPHILGTLGCRVLHLLPVNPTPTTFARFGRFGSAYACLDLTDIDPALVEFDKRTTGVEQFCELTRAVHRQGGRVILDMVINHTGWGSTLYETNPEWFLREPNGDFASPGAWGNTWADLVELNPSHVELWDHFTEAFLTWCRRGVDGFRCDAGYKVPLQVWQYVEARVRQEFPETLFLLEGLGGALEATESLLTEGGMQWAYSELFQNYSGGEVARYLDYGLRQCERVGVYVHYSETHDNNRLAAGGRVWSLLRNRLSALASASGGYGFTCGVEWLAAEKISVHGCTGLSWGSADNIVSELAELNRLLADHPCFFDGASMTRLSQLDSPVYALGRKSADGFDHVLVLVNTDAKNPQAARLNAEVCATFGSLQYDLLKQVPPSISQDGSDFVFTLAPGAVHCLSAAEKPAGMAGDEYRRRRAQSAWAIAAMSKVLLPEEIGPCPWPDLAERVATDPRGFLAALVALGRTRAKIDLAGALDAAKHSYPKVVVWSLLDRRRVTLVPPGHWLLIEDPGRFRASLNFQSGRLPEHAQSIEIGGGHVACFAPKNFEAAEDAELFLERYGSGEERLTARVRFLAPQPEMPTTLAQPPPDSLALLTNERGGMARVCLDLGRINSKYDCALAANLHPEVPVDRHVLAKRLRVWICADGFQTPLNLQNLVSFEIGPPAVWNFVAEAGDGRTVAVQLTADMLDGWNTTVFQFSRAARSRPPELPAQFDVRLIVRVDIEDRSYHSETIQNGGADHHFHANSQPLDERTGFAFTPAPDRSLMVFADGGVYHHEGEWCRGIAHPVEQSRGQTGWGDAYSPGWFELPLAKGQAMTLCLSADTVPPAAESIASFDQNRVATNKAAWKRAGCAEDSAFEKRLVLAAQSFLARRGSGRTIIAGYPWFLDWGRDTFISARGFLAAGLAADVDQLILTFGKFCQDGTMPNSIFGNDASNRDTSDAPLWYGVLCEETVARGSTSIYRLPVDNDGRTIADVLRGIAVAYARGTPNGIRMDAASGLIWSPAHFTWMDTNFPAGTPREGYPVEIQVLWIRLLQQLARLGASAESESWESLARRAQESLLRYFWLEKQGYLADALLARPGQPAADAVVSDALRCNYLQAVAFGLVTGEAARRCVDAALRYLVVPGALRTLAPLNVGTPLPIYGNNGQLLNDPRNPYWGRYEGDEDTRRKPAYHNGTAWPWQLPVFCESLVNAWDRSPTAVAAARAYLGSVDRLILEGCLGQIPEILDGDAPHQQRGCDAQAWSVLEALRVWKWLGTLE